jgi:two-component system cell cycle sensor histidine kinase/response regulator CckA
LTERLPSFIDFEFIPEPILVVEEGGSITFANSSAARLLGYRRRDLLGRPWQILLPEWHLKAYRRLLERYLSPGGGDEPPRRLRVHISRRDGGQNAVEITFRPLRVSGWSGVLNLVHERRIPRHPPGSGGFVPPLDMRLLSAAMDGFFLLSATGRFEECNDACCDMLGCTRAELLSLNLRTFESPDRPATLAQNLHEAAKTGRQRITTTLRRGDGSPVHVELSAAFPAYGPHRIACFMREAEVDGQAEHQLRNLSVAVEQSPASVLITDAGANIEYVNTKFVEVTGYTREEVMGRNPRILKSGEMPAEVYAELWATISSGNEWRGELLNRRKSGELFWEFASISPIKDSAGRIHNYIGVKEEITERKRLERQLLQAQKMEAIGRLAGGIAHDFNNLLTVISGYTQLLIERLTAEDASCAELVEIEKAASKAADLTSQLLSFSRKQFLKPVPLNLNDSVSGVFKLLRRLIGEDVEVMTRLEPDLGLVKADPTHIEQVLLNLAVNARDAMPNGGTLTIQTANVTLDEEYARVHNVILESGPYVMLSMSDTGSGMDQATRARIFEPFFTTKESGKGTGLGLSTAYGIIKQSGGYIWVYSEPGMGATFKIYLPRVGSAESLLSDPEEPRTLDGNETILLVEDNDALSKLCVKALERLGYTVLSATNVDEALQTFYQHPGVDLLLTDVVLPASTGRRLADHLTARNPGLKVLYVSGYPDDTITRLGVVEPGIQFLPKPFTPQALARRVRETLDMTEGKSDGDQNY